MKDKILLPKIRSTKPASRDTLVRLDAEVYDTVSDLAYKTAMSKKDIASILLRYALARVELVERKVYELNIANGSAEQEDEE